MSDLTPINEAAPELVQVSGAELMTLPGWELEQRAPIYLASDVHVSAYGARGFLLVDSKPENRVWGYNSNEYYGSGEVVAGSDEPNLAYGEPLDMSPLDVARRYGTRFGFKALRFFVLPQAVTDFFAQDKWLGEPAIAKCLEEDTTPKGYFEQPVSPGADMIMTDYHRSTEEAQVLQQEKLAALARILPLIDPHCSFEDFRTTRGDEYNAWFSGNRNQRAYISFHPWQIYQEVIGALTVSTQKALSNLDEALARFDTEGQGKLAAAQEWLSKGNPLREIAGQPLNEVLPQLPAGSEED